ncbi:MAG: hypothetical protein PHC61_04860 [Chitinivibrionales bacterium]|nr:hypothetical protein [Chitinivibrionales bacterium]
MNSLKRKMIQQAQKQYRSIWPCNDRNDFSESFTVEDEKVFFWFNTEDESTHVLTADLE